MKGNYLKLENTPWAGYLQRIIPPNTHQRKIMVSAKNVYDLVQPFVNFNEWCEWYIEDTPLRLNTDYFYHGQNKIVFLSISAAQAVLVMNDTDKSWQLFNALSDLIIKGFSNNS